MYVWHLFIDYLFGWRQSFAARTFTRCQNRERARDCCRHRCTLSHQLSSRFLSTCKRAFETSSSLPLMHRPRSMRKRSCHQSVACSLQARRLYNSSTLTSRDCLMVRSQAASSASPRAGASASRSSKPSRTSHQPILQLPSDTLPSASGAS